MPVSRSGLRKVSDMLRVKFEVNLSQRKIAASTGLPKAEVPTYMTRSAEVGLGWPWPPDIDEATTERLLFPTSAASAPRFTAPDDSTVR